MTTTAALSRPPGTMPAHLVGSLRLDGVAVRRFRPVRIGSASQPAWRPTTILTDRMHMAKSILTSGFYSDIRRSLLRPNLGHSASPSASP